LPIGPVAIRQRLRELAEVELWLLALDNYLAQVTWLGRLDRMDSDYSCNRGQRCRLRRSSVAARCRM
jgi:hypothetical protein